MSLIIAVFQIEINFLTSIFSAILVGICGDNTIQFLLASRKKTLLENIEKAMASLETMPSRSNYPTETQRWGISDFREIFFKPYRIIYEIKDKAVFIHAVLDGRRNCEDLLQQRLLRA